MSNTLILHKYTEDAYLEYAIATVKGRALAQVQDGLKPVQRRILFAMRQLGLTAAAKPVKSARVVGDVLGKYHPHGDSAAYEAMVRMAQKFTLRYPLVVGQGNFGSRDGDSAAAMRYTEAKLSAYSELLLDELGPGTVDFAPNYDGTLTEPVLLAARLPVLLLNGTMGIAVGMAADIPPHNMREVAAAATLLVKNPDTTLEEVLQEIKGPDFPEGGQLVSSESDIAAVYKTGRGSMRCRARWEQEDLARNQWQIVVTELPYQVSTKNILEQIDTLTNPSPPAGKKTITQQQANLKQLALEYLEKATDESNKDSATRIVLTPKTSKVDAAAMMAFLLANTSLEDTVSVNMTMIGLDGRPTTKNLLTVLSEWATFRLATVRRRTEWEKDVADKRIHILEGRLSVYNNLSAVVETIRNAEDPKKELIAKFALSEVQAEDTLEMRLRQLNKLEGLKLQKDVDELRAEVARLVTLLSSESKLRALVVAEIKRDSSKYADDRRTLVKHEAKAHTGAQAISLNVLAEDITVVVSKNLWVKAYKGHAVDSSSFAFKAGDSLMFKAETVSNKTVFLLDSRGRAYSFAAAQVPTGRGDGAPLGTLVEITPGAHVTAVIGGEDTDSYLFGGTNGFGFIAPLKSLLSRQKGGKTFLALESEEEAMVPTRITNTTDYLLFSSTEGKALSFAAAEVKSLPSGGKGVTLMALGDGCTLSSVSVAKEGVFKLDVIDPQTGGVSVLELGADDLKKIIGHRAKKGAFLPQKVVVKQKPLFVD